MALGLVEARTMPGAMVKVRANCNIVDVRPRTDIN